MASLVNFPAAGCIVEYLEDNSVQIAMVLETANDKLRLLLPTRRETKLSRNRLLPWLGPVYAENLSREESVKILEKHKSAREQMAENVAVLDVWELAQGEVDQADAAFFAELVESGPEADTVSAYGRALLGCRTHFRFQPPNFVVYPAEAVEKRLEEQRGREEREAIISGGGAFLKYLWDIAIKKRSRPIPPEMIPEKNLEEKIEALLFARMQNGDQAGEDALWTLLSKGLPEVPHLPYQLLVAWGKIPEHYNFWLDRAGFDAGDEWWKEDADEVDRIVEALKNPGFPEIVLPFISIDSESTTDIDDAFYIERLDKGWRVVIALACPALAWPFESSLDKKVFHRGTSIYLPEGSLHMLPEVLGTGACSLLADSPRPAFCLDMVVDEAGNPVSCEPRLVITRLAANLNYNDVQRLLDNPESENPAKPHADQLTIADEFAKLRENLRIENGAIIMRKPEQTIKLENSGSEVIVSLIPDPPKEDANRIVTEMMVLASSAFAKWALDTSLPVIFRTQNVTLPKEYAGIWTRPEDMAHVMRALVPSIMETECRPHAALAERHYAPVTSPLRRYADLVNEAQAIAMLSTGAPRWEQTELEDLLEKLVPALEGAGQAQKFRPRYWKLLYFRQQGDRRWWPGVITEENDNFVTVYLPDEGIYVRGKRNLFDERAAPGMNVSLRIGKVHPLYNEIHILEATASEQY